MSALTVGSLFSGIGGLDLGLERAGMKVIWQSEIDPYASRVLVVAYPAGVRQEEGEAPRRILGEGVPPETQAHWRSDSVRGASGRIRRAPVAVLQRMDDGLPSELDAERLKELGNAVVPQVAEWVGRRIVEAAGAVSVTEEPQP